MSSVWSGTYNIQNIQHTIGTYKTHLNIRAIFLLSLPITHSHTRVSTIREHAAQRQVQTLLSYSELRADYKYAKEHAGTDSEHLLFRSGAEFNRYASASVWGALKKTDQLSRSLQVRALPPMKCFQRMLGQMAAASTVCKLGLLHMRPAKEPGATECMAHRHLERN